MPLVDAGEQVVSQVGPIQELCEQEKEAEESLSLIAVSCGSHKGWLALPQGASKRKKDVSLTRFQKTKNMLFTMQLFVFEKGRDLCRHFCFSLLSS